MSRGQMDGIETLVKLGYNLSEDQMKAVRREYWNVTVESRERLQLGANERDLTEMPEYIDIMDKVLDMELRKSIFGGRLIQGARMENGYRGLYYRSSCA